MDEDVKSKFEELDKRLQVHEKRYDDIKWYVGGFAGLAGLGLAVLSILLGMNFSNERSSLREFKNDIKAELGKVEKPPEIQVLNVAGDALAGQEIKARVVKNENEPLRLNLTYSLRNAGESVTGPIYVKYYSNAPIVLRFESSDEKQRYKYEEYVTPNDIRPNELPGGYSTIQSVNLIINSTVVPPNGTYPMLLKVFYGKGKITQANFKVTINQN
jgi:hypothetical protein